MTLCCKLGYHFFRLLSLLIIKTFPFIINVNVNSAISERIVVHLVVPFLECCASFFKNVLESSWMMLRLQGRYVVGETSYTRRYT